MTEFEEVHFFGDKTYEVGEEGRGGNKTYEGGGGCTQQAVHVQDRQYTYRAGSTHEGL